MFVISSDWRDFVDKNECLLKRNWNILNDRRVELDKMGKIISPSNDHVFEVFSCIKPSDIKQVIVLPHPYDFDSGTGIPCMVRRNVKYRPKSLINIQKLFDVNDNNFDSIWQRGTMLINIALTEECWQSPKKIPHELFWSLLFEGFLDYLTSNYRDITFCFTGSTSNKYKKFIDTTNGHTIIDLPSITDDTFAEIYNTNVN